MKTVLKVLGIIICVALAGIGLFVGYSLYKNHKTLNEPRYEENYYEKFTSNYKLESKYAKKGEYKVQQIINKIDDKNIKNIRMWYPESLKGKEKIPMIIVVNGSQCPAKVYEPFFARLASWGFIVVGNDDPQAGTGESTSKTLDYVLNESELKECIDRDNIGIIGYSQGGAGAINAVTEFENSNKYKTIFTGSAAYPLLATNMGWQYDATKINIPYFMTAGTGKSDDMGVKDINEGFAGVAPLDSLIDIYNKMNNDVLKVRARVTGAEHEQMQDETDSYMTAWMLYHLKDDSEAKDVFLGEKAELLENNRWQDIEKNK